MDKTGKSVTFGSVYEQQCHLVDVLQGQIAVLEGLAEKLFGFQRPSRPEEPMDERIRRANSGGFLEGYMTQTSLTVEASNRLGEVIDKMKLLLD